MRCSGCDGTRTQRLFSLGAIPPVNDFLEPAQVAAERGYPLDLYFCQDCALVQLGERVPPVSLFSHYLHVSGASKGQVAHLESVAALVAARHAAGGAGLGGAKVLEIGSNDGTLLKLLKGKGGAVVGVDPAQNLGTQAKAQGLDVVIDFFSERVGTELRKSRGAFDFVVALNVVAHTPDFISLLKGVTATLAPDGQFMLENAYVVETILKGQFDTIYHEHVYCFSLSALTHAFARAGLKITDAEVIPTQGCSIRVFGAPIASSRVPSPRVQALLDAERAKGFLDARSFAEVGGRVESFRKDLRAKVQSLNARFGAKTVGLGAPARGVVVLNYCGLGTAELELVVDDTRLKQGRLVPGVHVPVGGWDALERLPDVPRAYLLLSWNYRKDMLERLAKTLKTKQGVVILPFPELSEVPVGAP
jgi:2-polyprenyl-3-methyl-5-hydroxy-6-metoxy-1,4-benzoquinol methylase